MDEAGIGIRHVRVLAAEVERVHRAAPCILEDRVDGIWMIAVADGAVIEAVVVLGRRVLAEPCLCHVDVPLAAERAEGIRPLRERVRLVRRRDEVTRLHVELDAKIRRSLNVWLPAHGDDTAARDADVALEQLHDREAADVLDADRMLRHAERVHDDGRALVVDPDVGSALDVIGRHARDIRDHLDRVAAVELLETREDRVRCKEIIGLLRLAVRAERIAPALLVRVRLLGLIEAGEQAVVEREVVAQQAGSVRIAQHVILVELLTLEHLRDDVAHEGDVRAWAQLEELVRDLRRARVADVDVDDLGAVLLTRLHDILEAHRMAFREVRALDPDELRVLVDVDDAKCAGHLDVLVAFLVVDLRAADKGEPVRAADLIRLAVNLFGLLPALLAGILHGLCRPVDGLVPADLLPVVTARRAVQWLRRALLRVRDRRVTESLAAERTAIDRAVRRTLEVDELAVLHIADDAAAAGAEVAD